MAPQASATHTGPPHGFSSASTGALAFTTFRCEFTVPDLPVTYSQQSVLLWCGIQQAGPVDGSTTFGVLQPVVMYGPDCTSSTLGLGPAADPEYARQPYWYYSAQSVHATPDGGSICDTSPDGFQAVPGEVLVSTMAYDAGADAVIVSIARADGTDESTFVATHPLMDPTRSWAPLIGQMRLIMAVETVDMTGPTDWPARPVSWPVTMRYGGTDPDAFRPRPVSSTEPALECDEPTVGAGAATSVCTYDLASTQPPAPLTPATSSVPPSSDRATVTAVGPRFTG